MGRIWMPGGGGGADLDVVTAGANDVVAPKVIVGPDGEPISGNLVDQPLGVAASGFRNGGSNVFFVDFPKGAYRQESSVGLPSINVTAEQIRNAGGLTAAKLAQGQSAFGLTGTYKGLGNAAAADVRSGKTFSTAALSNAAGTMPEQGGSTTTPGTVAKTIVAANRYVTGNIVVAGDANLVPGNIKKNVTIFGVKGTFEGYVADTTDLFDNGNNAAGFSLNRDGQITGGAIYYPKKYSNYVFAILTGSKSYPFANYNSLNIDFYITVQSGNSEENLIQLYNGSTPVAAYNYTSGYYPAGRRTVTINISAVGGSFVPVIKIDSSFTWNGSMYIYKIWLS